MKKIFFLSLFFSWLIILSFYFSHFSQPVKAVESYKLNITPIPCSRAPGLGDCPTDLQPVYQSEPCVSSYETFIQDPINQHFWAVDPQITSQGKTDERARQFIYWAVNRSSVDEHPVLKSIWSFSRNIVIFIIILVVAVSGIGFIIGQRANFDFKIKIWPLIFRIASLLLYVSFSAAIVLFLIQISEILMKFFIEKLGGQDLFNIYFAGTSVEKNYTDFIGCRDLNFKVQESIETSLFLLKLTNIIYYIVGGMLILRKIILWFLLFISPFLAIFVPFVFIRNIGWIWIGVFFQWLFYGPIFALFLGALAKIWRTGIPFPFDFSRTNQLAGYIYPTGMNIVYGGPAQIAAQQIGALNSGNYVDTFTEYVISLIMLLAVALFPWWLLRIFRDYCCDGIYATKNILMSIYDSLRGGPTPTPPPTPQSPTATISTALKMPKKVEIPVKVHLETIEEIRKTKTEDISRSLNISTKKLTDIASFETNKQVQQTVKRNIEYLANPTKAKTPSERQRFMNIRTELFNRAVKRDPLAQSILSSVSSSKVEQQQKRQQLIKTVPKMVPVTQVVSVKVGLSREKVNTITSSLVNVVSTNTQLVNTLAETVNLPPQQIQLILHLMVQNLNKPVNAITQEISQQTHLRKEKVDQVFKTIVQAMKTNKKLLETIAEKENIPSTTLNKFIEEQVSVMVEPEKHLTEVITIPPTVSIEEYESVKKMWQKQYEEGEVPLTENIKSRAAWVEHDAVFITNTLNKLLSPNEELRNQGLEDLGYILPIFLINNLSGEQLTVYLKAKLEAAKTVSEQLAKEKEITEKLKAKSEEELVEVAAPKKEEAKKTMEMTEELKVKSEK